MALRYILILNVCTLAKKVFHSPKQILQLVLQEEVSPDRSSAKRSQTTGNLLLTMPKARQTLVAKRKSKEPTRTVWGFNGKDSGKDVKGSTTNSSLLEVDPSLRKGADFANIVPENKSNGKPSVQTLGGVTKLVSELTCEDGEPVTEGEEFVDDPDVPPLI